MTTIFLPVFAVSCLLTYYDYTRSALFLVGSFGIAGICWQYSEGLGTLQDALIYSFVCIIAVSIVWWSIVPNRAPD
jgi:hypothetical protein